MYVKKKLANFKSFKGENNIFEFSPHINYLIKIIYVFLTIFLYLLKCPQSLIL